jgi:hypothetical protein
VDNIKMNLGETGWDGMDWIDLAQDKDQWRATVNTVMNIWAPENAGEFLSNERLAASQEGVSLCVAFNTLQIGLLMHIISGGFSPTERGGQGRTNIPPPNASI